MSKRYFLFILQALIWLVLGGLAAQPGMWANAQKPEPPGPEAGEEGGMVALPDRFAFPELPENPTQADLGEQVYWMVCMACHGDQGQGLTPEWVESWELGEQTCWSSKCHASNHPPEGFELPRFIPAVVSPAIPGRFETALALHDYLAANMPWHAPGTQTEEEYWQLTAYLVRANGIDPGRELLDAERAAQLRLRPALPAPTTETSATLSGAAPAAYGAAVMLTLGVGLVMIRYLARRRAG